MHQMRKPLKFHTQTCSLTISHPVTIAYLCKLRRRLHSTVWYMWVYSVMTCMACGPPARLKPLGGAAQCRGLYSEAVLECQALVALTPCLHHSRSAEQLGQGIGGSRRLGCIDVVVAPCLMGCLRVGGGGGSAVAVLGGGLARGGRGVGLLRLGDEADGGRLLPGLGVAVRRQVSVDQAGAVLPRCGHRL